MDYPQFLQHGRLLSKAVARRPSRKNSEDEGADTQTNSDLKRGLTVLEKLGVAGEAASAWLSEYRIVGYGRKTPMQVASQYGELPVLDFLESVKAAMYA